MPDDAQFARCTFPGIFAVIRFTGTIGHGITPGVFLLDIAPQPAPPKLIGTLTLEYGGESLSFDECRVVAASYKRDGSGRIVQLTIEDWRWRWRFGYISGRYNTREPQSSEIDGTPNIIPHTKKTAKELATLCFEEMGETDFSVANLPDDVFPEINWDVESAAGALAALCDLLGYRIVPVGYNRTEIFATGEGSPLPVSLTRTDASDILDPPEKPSQLAVVGNGVEFQCDFELEWLAEDVDGEYVPMNEAVYKPAGGWEDSDYPDFTRVSTDLGYRDLARRSVYRVARIKIPKDGLAIPGYTDLTEDKIKRIDQLVVLERQCETERQHGFKQVFKRPYIYGAFEGDANFGDDVGDNGQDVPKPLESLTAEEQKECTLNDSGSYDHERGVLHISQVMFRKQDKDDVIDGVAVKAGTMQPAQLRYRVAVHIRAEDTNAIERYIRKRDYGPPPGSATPTKAEVIYRDEITYRFVPTYEEDFTVNSVRTIGRPEADKEADYYLNQREKQWINAAQAEASYAGIFISFNGLWLDGAIQHIVYSGGTNEPAMTRISRNTEMKKYITPYKERRQYEQINFLIKKEDRLT